MTPLTQVEQFDAGDFKALKVEMSNLSANMQRLSNTIEQNTKQLSKIEVLEVNHNHQSQALERAFGAVSALEADLNTHEKNDGEEHEILAKSLGDHATENTKEHRQYDKFIYLCMGFVTAVCMFWTIFGIRINNTIDETIKSVTELKTLMAVEASKPPKALVGHSHNGNGE